MITVWPLATPTAFPDPMAAGSLVYGSTVPYVLTELPIGAAGQVVRSNGTVPAYSAATYPNTFAAGDLPYATSADTLGVLPIGTAGKLVQSSGTLPIYSAFVAPLSVATGDLWQGTGSNALAALPSVAAGSYLRSAGVGTASVWSTLTLPNAASTGDTLYASGANAVSMLAIGSAGKIYRSTGTLPAWSTATYPDTVLSGALLYGSSSNAVGGLAIAASNSVLTSSGTLPQWSATLPYGSLPSAGGTWNYGSANTLVLAGLLQGNSHVAFGNTPDTTIGMRMNLSTTFTSTAQTGIFCDPIFQSSATSTGRSILGRVRTAAASFTLVDAAALYVQNASLGAGSAVTNLVGLDIAAISGGANNWSIRTGSTQCQFGGAVLIDGALDHNGSTAGVFSVTPTTRASAYSQTYTTATKTHANFTSADLSGITSSTTGSALSEPSVAYVQLEHQTNYRRVQDQFNALRADVANLKQLVNSVIDDHQAYGWFQ